MVTTATSTSAPKLSAAGRTSLNGLAILANPRSIPASKTIVIDAQLYLGSAGQDLLIGSLRYFNSTDTIFDDEPCLYFVSATVSILLSSYQHILVNFQFARRESTADVPVSGDRTLLDYSFIGDIHCVSNIIPPYEIRLRLKYFLPDYSTWSSRSTLSSS